MGDSVECASPPRQFNVAFLSPNFRETTLRKYAILTLADGTVFEGFSIGAETIGVGEVVFNTAMTGYQEILTDPSYAKQIVTLTAPHIGNTGVNADDEESAGLYVAGLVIRDLPLQTSSFRSEKTLTEYLRENNIAAICDIDTRRLTRLLLSLIHI